MEGHCFTNISSYRWNQRLIFGMLAVLDLVNTFTGSDLDCGSHINQKMQETGDPYINVQEHCSSAFPLIRGFFRSDAGGWDSENICK